MAVDCFDEVRSSHAVCRCAPLGSSRVRSTQGLRYIEVRLAPQLHIDPNKEEVSDVSLVLRAVDRGLRRAAVEFNQHPAVLDGSEPGYQYGIIVCAMRKFTAHFSPYFKRSPCSCRACTRAGGLRDGTRQLHGCPPARGPSARVRPRLDGARVVCHQRARRISPADRGHRHRRRGAWLPCRWVRSPCAVPPSPSTDTSALCADTHAQAYMVSCRERLHAPLSLRSG
jgi:hypothetical protein